MEQYRRWLVVGSATLMLAAVLGTLVNGLTAFFIPIEAAEGWRRSDIAAINSFGLLGLAVGSVIMGFVSDRIGIREAAVESAGGGAQSVFSTGRIPFITA